MNELQGVLQPEGQVNYSESRRHQSLASARRRFLDGCSRANESWHSLINGSNQLVHQRTSTLWHGATTAGPDVTKAFCTESPDEEKEWPIVEHRTGCSLQKPLHIQYDYWGRGMLGKSWAENSTYGSRSSSQNKKHFRTLAVINCAAWTDVVQRTTNHLEGGANDSCLEHQLITYLKNGSTPYKPTLPLHIRKDK